MPKKTFETMNALRGLAALIVVIWHGGSHWYGKLVLPSSYLAVDLFFVLSGFVIAHSYQARLAGDMTVKQFFVIRFIRLYPIYFLGTMITCVTALAWFIIRSEASNYLVALHTLPFAIAMLPAPSSISGQIYGDLYPLNVPAWSLFCEIIVNLAYAASFKLWSTRNILIMMAISSILMLSNDCFAVEQGWGAGGYNWISWPFGLLRVFYAFPAGVLIYRTIYERKFPLPNLRSFVILLICPLLFAGHADWFCKLVMFIGIPLLVAFAAKSEPRGLLGRLSAVFGAASYAIYAIHFPLIGLIVPVEHKFGLNSYANYVGVFFLVMIVVIALLIDRWFDQPMRRVLTRLFARPLPYATRTQG